VLIYKVLIATVALTKPKVSYLQSEPIHTVSYTVTCTFEHVVVWRFLKSRHHLLFYSHFSVCHKGQHYKVIADDDDDDGDWCFIGAHGRLNGLSDLLR